MFYDLCDASDAHRRASDVRPVGDLFKSVLHGIVAYGFFVECDDFLDLTLSEVYDIAAEYNYLTTVRAGSDNDLRYGIDQW